MLKTLTVEYCNGYAAQSLCLLPITSNYCSLKNPRFLMNPFSNYSHSSTSNNLVLRYIAGGRQWKGVGGGQFSCLGVSSRVLPQQNLNSSACGLPAPGIGGGCERQGRGRRLGGWANRASSGSSLTWRMSTPNTLNRVKNTLNPPQTHSTSPFSKRYAPRRKDLAPNFIQRR